MKAEEIRLLLAKVHYGMASSQDRHTLETILRQSESARQLQAEFKELQETTPFLTDEAVSDTWKTIQPRIQELLEARTIEPKSIKPERKSKGRWLAVAAAILVVISITTLLFWRPWQTTEYKGIQHATLTLSNGKTIILNADEKARWNVAGMPISIHNRELRIGEVMEGSDVDGWNTLSVPKKLDFKVRLPDSSVVWLNSTSELRFPTHFSHSQRSVKLIYGEAFFDISHRADLPFTVQMSQGKITVLGTQFNVDAYDSSRVITSLLEGKLRVDALSGQSILLAPSQQVVTQQGKAMELQAVNTSQTVDWRSGIHYFNDASVEELADMFDRWFDVKLVIDNDQVAQQKFRGRLDRNQPIDIFIKAINLTGNATFYWKDGVLHCK